MSARGSGAGTLHPSPPSGSFIDQGDGNWGDQSEFGDAEDYVPEDPWALELDDPERESQEESDDLDEDGLDENDLDEDDLDEDDLGDELDDDLDDDLYEADEYDDEDDDEEEWD